MCSSHFRFSSKCTPRYFVVLTLLISLSPMVIGRVIPRLDSLKSVPMNIYSVLVTLRLSLFTNNQFLTFFKSSFNLNNSSVDDLEAAFKIVSSAYMCGLVCDRQAGRSFI